MRASIVLAAALLGASAPTATAKLQPGDPFPTTSAKSLAGAAVTLPADAHHRAFVAIFGFSRASGDPMQRFGHALYARVPHDVAVFAIADLSRVPGLFRGFAVSGIRKSASPAHPEHDSNVLIVSESNAWASLVPGGDDGDAVVVAVDAGGDVLSIVREPYSDAAAEQTAREFGAQPAGAASR